MNKTFAAMLAGTVCLIGFSASAFPITYTFTTIGSGSLGGQSFDGALVTITSTADTSQIVNLGGGIFHLNDLSSSVSIAGLGDATFNIPTENVANNNIEAAGFSAPNQNAAILFVESNSALSTYGLDTSIGPVTGTPLFNPGDAFGTTDGDFILESARNVTFTALAGDQTTVPDTASTFGLMGLGFVALFAGSRKFSRAA